MAEIKLKKSIIVQLILDRIEAEYRRREAEYFCRLLQNYLRKDTNLEEPEYV